MSVFINYRLTEGIRPNVFRVVGVYATQAEANIAADQDEMRVAPVGSFTNDCEPSWFYDAVNNSVARMIVPTIAEERRAELESLLCTRLLEWPPTADAYFRTPERNVTGEVRNLYATCLSAMKIDANLEDDAKFAIIKSVVNTAPLVALKQVKANPSWTKYLASASFGKYGDSVAQVNERSFASFGSDGEPVAHINVKLGENPFQEDVEAYS